jgi:YesN/AraC family two-component response regulator
VADRYRVLWVDYRISTKDAEAIDGFSEYFDMRQYQPIHSLDREIESVDPDVLCFDYDFPTKPALEALRETKRRFPSIPMLMLTVQHSEALAVWAFRSRVWDYLVKPISRSELERCLSGLMEMLKLRAGQTAGRKAASHGSLIPEDNRWRGPRGNASNILTPAIEYVENNFREKISSADVAELCNLTTFQLSRAFRETYNLTFQDYVTRYRIREACRLLRNPAADIGDVGSLVGFNDASYFAKVFRRYLDCSPSQFQTSHQQDDATLRLLAPEDVVEQNHSSDKN